MIKFPVIMINFKSYESAIGEDALSLAKICDEVSKETGKSISICVSPVDLYKISSIVDIPVLSEHVDPEDFGAHTGKILIKDIKDNGAVGSLLNHSEDRYRIDKLEKSVSKLRENNLISVVCANDDLMIKVVSDFNPDILAIEPPELIGGDVSVTDADPEIIRKAVSKVKNIPVLCGAGIKNGSDVRVALKLGCEGVLIASGVTKAKDPKKVLLDLVSGFDDLEE